MALTNLEDVLFEYFGFATPKESEYLELLNYHMIKSYNSGHFDFLQKKYQQFRCM